MARYMLATEIKENVNTSDRVLSKNYTLSEVVINIENVLFVRQDDKFKKRLLDFKQWPEEMDKRVCFTKLYMNSGGGLTSTDIVVVGDLLATLEKMEQTDGK
jgi:hypothetical protein